MSSRISRVKMSVLFSVYRQLLYNGRDGFSNLAVPFSETTVDIAGEDEGYATGLH